MVGVVLAKQAVEGGHSLGLGAISSFFQRGEDAERHVEHIFLGPDGATVVGRIAVVVAFGREREGNFVFVIVRFVVATEAHEHGQLVVAEHRRVLLEGIGVDEHLDAFVLPQVEHRVAIDGLRLVVAEVGDGHCECLLVVFDELGLRGVGVAADSRRQHVVHRRFIVVFLDVHCADGHFSALRSRVVEVLLIDAPLAAHEVERSEAHNDGMLEFGEEHSHKANRREIVDATDAVVVVFEWNAEQIPHDVTVFAVAQRLGVFALIDDVVLTHNEVLRTYRNAILVVFFVFVERVVLVDVLDVGRGFVRGVVALGARVVVGRVALRIVDVFVATDDVGTHIVVVGTAEIVVVVVRRVVHNAVEHGGRHFSLNLPQKVLISLVTALFLVVHTIQTHVLTGSTATRRRKGVGDGRLRRNLTPLGERESVGTIDGHTAFIEFLSVAQHVLAHFTEVDVEVAAVLVGIGLLVRIKERVHHPEFDVSDVGGLEIGGFEFAHHTAPVLCRIVEFTVGCEVGVEVVRTTLVGVIGDVENRQGGSGTAVTALVAVGEEFVGIDFANVVVGKLVEVALDVAGREARRTAREERVDGVPRHLRTIETAREACFVVTFREFRRHARQQPRGRCGNVDGRFRILEIVDIRGIVLRSATLSRDELGKFTRERELRRLRQAQEGDFVEQIRQPLTLFLPIHIHAPNRVVQRFRTHIYLRRERLFGKVLQCTAQLEIFREIVSPVHAEHRFSHLSPVGVAFERHVDGRSSVDDALVENRHLARAVVHGVVAAFAERHTACRHHDRALRHVLRTERNHVGRSSSELSRQHELVLFGDLLRDGHRRVVEFGEGISLRFFVADSLGSQVFIKILTKRLSGWEENATVRHGVALDKVETTIGMDFHIVV